MFDRALRFFRGTTRAGWLAGILGVGVACGPDVETEEPKGSTTSAIDPGPSAAAEGVESVPLWNSFESAADLTGWGLWANCATDGWSAGLAPWTPLDGNSYLRLHTEAFTCDASGYPGVYAQSPWMPATAGATYTANGFSRVGGAEGSVTIIFLDGAGQEIAWPTVPLPADRWDWTQDTLLVASAPAGTQGMMIRYSVTSQHSYIDIDAISIGVHSPSYFGYYWGRSPDAFKDHANCAFVDHAPNSTDPATLAVYDADGIRALKNGGLKAIVNVSGVFFDADDGYRLRDDWATRWDAYWEGIFASLPDVLAFSPVDEPDNTAPDSKPNISGLSGVTQRMKVDIDAYNRQSGQTIHTLLTITGHGVATNYPVPSGMSGRAIRISSSRTIAFSG